MKYIAHLLHTKLQKVVCKPTNNKKIPIKKNYAYCSCKSMDIGLFCWHGIYSPFHFTQGNMPQGWNCRKTMKGAHYPIL